MRKFKDLGIELEKKSFVGEKKKIVKIINKEIAIYDYKIEPSKYEGLCLWMQIEMEQTKHVIFTGSVYLMELIQKIPREEFPIVTTIIEENEHYEFS